MTEEAGHLRMELQHSNIKYEELTEEYSTIKKSYDNQLTLINKYESEKDEHSDIIKNNTQVILKILNIYKY